MTVTTYTKIQDDKEGTCFIATCDICGAVVPEVLQERHSKWHETLRTAAIMYGAGL